MMKNYTLVISGGCGSSRLCMTKDLIRWFNSLGKNDQNNEFIRRLYEKYVRFEDLEKTEKALFAIRNISKVAKTLYEGYIVCKERSLLFWKDWNKYMPIHIQILDRPYFYYCIGNEIPLTDIDNLEGDPLWMRPEYMLEKYGGKEGAL